MNWLFKLLGIKRKKKEIVKLGASAAFKQKSDLPSKRYFPTINEKDEAEDRRRRVLRYEEDAKKYEEEKRKTQNDHSDMFLFGAIIGSDRSSSQDDTHSVNEGDRESTFEGFGGGSGGGSGASVSWADDDDSSSSSSDSGSSYDSSSSDSGSSDSGGCDGGGSSD